MRIQFQPCITDEDFAKVSLFILERRRDLHPSFSTIDVVTLVHTYITEGFLYQGADADGRIIAASAYYHGTAEQEYKDRDVAFIDIAILDRAYQGTRSFIRGLKSMVEWIMKEHPEVENVMFAALSENAYVCKLYSKFSKFSHVRDGAIGQEHVFCDKISQIRTVLQKYDPV